MTITERIFVEISQKNIVQKDFAAQIDVNEKTFSAWKKNNSLPPADKLSKISECLGVSLEYLLTGEEKNCKESLSKVERQFIDKFKKLEPIDQGKILERMDVIYESYPLAAVQEPADVFSEPAEPTAASLDQKKHLA